jgi:hypothetical protein
MLVMANFPAVTEQGNVVVRGGMSSGMDIEGLNSIASILLNYQTSEEPDGSRIQFIANQNVFISSPTRMY